jgi:hypothetical protein
VKARRLAAAALLAAALPATAYILPVPAILRRVAEKRASLSLSSLEATGTFQAEGPTAAAIAQVIRADARPQVTVPARLDLKVPGRCRLELLPPGTPASDRPFVSVRDARVTGARGLDGLPEVVALVRSACTLLAVHASGGAYASALGRRGVALGEASLGRFDGRVAYVVGGHARDARPLAYFDKQAFQPLRLLSLDGGTLWDVRLLGFGTPPGGDAFPHAIEAWQREERRASFTAERTAPNARVPETLFP